VPAGYADRVQATVHRFDPLTGAGAVITDAGEVIPFDPEVLASTPLRHLRVGQRLTVVLDDDGGRHVVRFTLGRVGASGNQARP